MTDTQITPEPTPRTFTAPRTVAPGGSDLLASDTERERVADRLRAAAAAGGLTLSEADERQAAVYAARTRAELVPLVSDLPGPPRPTGRPPRAPMTDRARRRFGVHVAVVAVLFVVLVTAWALGSAPFFWPAWPSFWLGLSLFVHARRAEREPSEQLPEELR